MKIEIKHREVYGQRLAYVCDPAVAEAVSTLTGCRSLRNRDIPALRALGHEIIDLDQVLAAMFQ